MAAGAGDSFWLTVHADGHRQLLLLQCRAKSQAGFAERDSWHPGLWPPQPLPPSTNGRWVRAPAAGPGLSGAAAPRQPPPWLWMARQERSRVCSGLFYVLPAGLQDLLFVSRCWHWRLAEPDTRGRAGKRQKADVWPERRGLVLEHGCATRLRRLLRVPQRGCGVYTLLLLLVSRSNPGSKNLRIWPGWKKHQCVGNISISFSCPRCLGDPPNLAWASKGANPQNISWGSKREKEMPKPMPRTQ